MIPKKLPNLGKVKQQEQAQQQKAQEQKIERNPDGSIKKPHLPKSRYDENGMPELTIPNLNDLDLGSSMNKYLN